MILQMFSMGLRSGEFALQPSLVIKFGKFLCHHVWVAFEVWAGAPSWTNVISFFELNSFLSIGPPVTWRLDINGFTLLSQVFGWCSKVWPVGSMCNYVSPRPVMPPHTITFKLCFTWKAGGTSHSWSPNRYLFWIRVLEKIFRTLICK